MTKDQERAILNSIVDMVKESGATGCSYGLEALGDFVARWTDAIDNDLPMECARDVLASAHYEASQALNTATVKAQAIVREAETKAEALDKQADQAMSYARSVIHEATKILNR